MNSLYSEILKKAWQTIWHHKSLWFFGLFVLFIGQEIEIVLRNIYTYQDKTLTLESWRALFQNGFGGGYATLWDTITQTTAGTALFILMVLVVGAFIVWLTVVSAGGLIHGTMQIENNKPYLFYESMHVGQKNFRPNFFIYLLAKVFDYVVLIGFGLIASLAVLGALKTTVALILVIISVFVSLILSFVAKYAACYVVARNQNASTAIRSGWRLFTKHWVTSLEMAIIIFLINFIVSLILLFVVILIAVPFLLLTMILNQGALPSLGVLLIYLLTAISFMILIVVGSGISSFQLSAWVLLFLRLDQGKQVGFFTRIFRGLTRSKNAAKM